MKNLKIYLVAAGLLMMACSSCGSVKRTVKSNVAVHEVSNTKADSSSVVNTVTKTYGDSLTVMNFVPAPSLVDTGKIKDTASYSDTESSNGIKYKETFTPQYRNGVFSGDKVSVSAIAKPITTTDTQAAKASQVSTTIVKDSTAKVQSTTTQKIGFGLPAWVWLVIGLLAVGVVVYFFRSYLKFL